MFNFDIRICFSWPNLSRPTSTPGALHFTVSSNPPSQVLKGKVRVRSYRWKGDPHLSHHHGGEAILHSDTLLDSSSPPMVLDSVHNLHEVEAEEDSTLLDLLAPPYKDGENDCHYFEAKPKGSKGGKLFTMSQTLPLGFMCEQAEYLGPALEVEEEEL